MSAAPGNFSRAFVWHKKVGEAERKGAALGIMLLRHQLEAHNRHVLLGTLVAALAASLVWAGLYFLGQWLVLFGLTVVRGEEAQMPADYNRWFLTYAGITVLLGWGWSLWRRRRPRLRDRAILGPHLIPEFLFLPAALTFSIPANLTAYRRVHPDLLQACRLVLQELLRHPRLEASKIARLDLSPPLLDEALLTLQFAGLVDLHRGDTDWFYTARSSRRSEIEACLQTHNLSD